VLWGGGSLSVVCAGERGDASVCGVGRGTGWMSNSHSPHEGATCGGVWRRSTCVLEGGSPSGYCKHLGQLRHVLQQLLP
jgi:hypothetical protein